MSKEKIDMAYRSMLGLNETIQRGILPKGETDGGKYSNYSSPG
jgi:hypothetical protein